MMALPLVRCASSANWLAAASIWRRLLMQALACEVARAFTKFGMAMAARRPMMATTIMISTSVKPALCLECLVFIRLVFFLFITCPRREPATGGCILLLGFKLTDCLLQPLTGLIKQPSGLFVGCPPTRHAAYPLKLW